MKPFSPSKIGDGPVMPCRASIAANRPFLLAFEKAQAFHIDMSPTLVCLSATLATPARLTACIVLRSESPMTLATPSAEENGP